MTERPFALDFPLNGSRLIEASAGTGKTFTIAALYVRLVLSHGGENGFSRPLLPAEILVTTFTEAATEELRDRIRLRLTEAARHFRAELEKPDDFLVRLRADYPEIEWPICARRLDAAAESMDEAAVSTIHSWCNRMLREHAFDSGSLFTQSLEADQSELYEEAVRDYWRLFITGLSREAAGLVQEKWKQPGDLRKSIDLLVRNPDPDALDLSVADRLEEIAEHKRNAVAEARNHPWETWLAELTALFEKGQEQRAFNGSKIRRTSWPQWLDALREWTQATAPDAIPDLKDSTWDRLTPAGIADAWKGDPPEHPAFEVIETLRELLDKQPDFLPELQRHAGAWVAQRADAQKRWRTELDFNDLLTRFGAALSGPGGEPLASAVRRQFPVALVDEFQDTDPVQYGIVDRIYSIAETHDDRAVFMIGDPKQAIYSFRDADIYAYLNARRATAGRHHTLDRNFRSTQPMVEVVNRLFEQAESWPAGAFLFRDGDDNEVPFQPVAAQGRPDEFEVNGEGAAAMTIREVQGGQVLSKGDYLARSAAICATEMVALLNHGARRRAGFKGEESDIDPLRPADMAVLVRDGVEAKAIRTALAARGVRSVYLSDKDSVFETPEAADVLRWLQACAEPSRDRWLRAALATGTLDLDWVELERLNRDELHWEACVMQFHGFRQIWRRQGVLPMLRALMTEFRVPARLLAEPNGGERALTNLLHLAELLQRASAEVEGEQALIRYLAEHIDDANGRVDDQIVRLESDEDLVKVVTIHKSKGLEYPLVFLPFVCTFKEVTSQKVKTRNVPVRYHDEAGALRLDVDPDEDAIALADRERLAEELRLLYVAVTRARYGCWLNVADLKYGTKKTGELHKSALGYLLNSGEPISKGGLRALMQQRLGSCADILITDAPQPTNSAFIPLQEERPLEEARTPKRSAREFWWIASYSALKIGAGAADEGTAGEAPETAAEANFDEVEDENALPERSAAAPETGPHGFPPGPESGTFLHGLLEWAARQGFSRMMDEPKALEEEIRARCSLRGWTHHIEGLTAWMREVLETPLRLPNGGPVVLGALTTYQPELEFWFQSQSVDTRALDRAVRARTLGDAPRPGLLENELNGMLKGFIDLVFEHEGRYYVADYKSNRLGAADDAYTDEALRDAVLKKRYDLQYVLYTLALHRLLKARRQQEYDYDRHMGGAVYLFLRGIGAPTQGVFLERPPRALIEGLDRMFRGLADAPGTAERGESA